MTDDLDSSSKGIWVFPHDPTLESVAGPSKPRQGPLEDIYQSSLEAYRSAYEAYEDKRTEEQLDDITDWLDHSLAASSNRFHRLSVGILQNPAKQVHGQIKTINTHLEVIGIQGRDIVDTGTGIKAITAGILKEEEAVADVKIPGKSGLTGLDLVEQWYKARKDSDKIAPTVVLHIQDAQVVPPPVLAEIMYIISLHPNLPIRLLLSVPSVNTFLTQWQMLEPSSVDLTILSSRGRRKQTALGAILDSGRKNAAISVGDELAEVLRADEGMYGHGPEGALKAIQWSMLHHSANSPLSSLDPEDSGDQDKLKTVRAMLDTMRSEPDTSIPGREVFQLSAHGDLANVTNPAPRISILQALSTPSLFVEGLPLPAAAGARQGVPHPASSPKTTPRKPSKRRKASPSPLPEPAVDPSADRPNDDKGDLKDLETLFGLWKGAGKNVNLWDWLQGYKNSMSGGPEGEADEGADAAMDMDMNADADAGVGGTLGKKRPRDDDGELEKSGLNEDRLHATFVRFCEEARMLGLVRARGKAAGRKADEVVKGVTLV